MRYERQANNPRDQREDKSKTVKVARAQGCRAKLEVLEIGLTVGQLDIRQATTEYLKCVEDAAFLETA